MPHVMMTNTSISVIGGSMFGARNLNSPSKMIKKCRLPSLSLVHGLFILHYKTHGINISKDIGVAMIPSFMFTFGFHNKFYLNQNMHVFCTSVKVEDTFSNAPFKLIKRRFAHNGLYKLVK
jgi:hypothetical protein